MDINDLKKIGAIYTNKPEKKTIKWNNCGEDVEFTVFVCKLPYGDIERILKAESYTIALISEGLRLGDNGNERLSYEEAAMLDPSLANLFVQAINEVNTRDKKKA